MKINLALSVSLFAGLIACSANLESSTFNVYLYPDGDRPEIYLWQTRESSHCQNMAWSLKNEKIWIITRDISGITNQILGLVHRITNNL